MTTIDRGRSVDAGLDDILRQALQPLLRDLRRDGLKEPRVEDRDDTDDAERPSAVLWSSDGNGSRAWVSRSAVGYERVMEVATGQHVVSAVGDERP